MNHTEILRFFNKWRRGDAESGALDASGITPKMIGEAIDACVEDAERYRRLRQAHWWESPICVVRDPKRQVKPGTDCPSGDRLDEAVDALKAQEACNG